MNALTTNLPKDAARFETHVQQAVGSVRSAFGAIAASLPGSPSRAHELQRALDIDKKLAWKIASVVNDADPFAAAKQLPGPAGVDIFLEAARARQVPAELIDQARGALRDFDGLIEVHAGDRVTLEMMMGGFATRSRDKIDTGHRRAAFRAQSYLWGVQAKTHLRAGFIAPAASDPTRLDIVSIRGFVGFRRIRPNVTWVIARTKLSDNDGEVRGSQSRLPLDPSRGAADVPLVTDFCSERLPEFRRLDGGGGYCEDEVVEGPVGDTAAMTLLTGEIFRAGAVRYRNEHNTFGRIGAHVFTPCEALVLDLVVHSEAFGPIQPGFAIYSALGSASLFPAGRHRVLEPAHETAEYLGRGPLVMHTADVPDYVRLSQYVFNRMEWDGEAFDVFRVRVAYPLMPTSNILSHAMPEQPA